ncbi:MAG: RHS repeat domain-containing protein, partial [Candidatus Dormibacteria bacterium]
SYNPAGQILTRGVTNDAYTVTPPVTTGSYTTNGLNQYPTTNGGANAYDARGDQTLEGGSGKAWTYDLSNQLLTANLPTAVTLTYDPIGRLASSTAGSATSSFLFAGTMLAGEYDGTTIVGRYIPGPGADEPLLWYAGAGTAAPQWLEADQQGSIIAWSNASGASGATYVRIPR